MGSATRLLALSVGGLLGIHARYGVNVAMARLISHPFPWATLVVNIVGSFAIGFAATILAAQAPNSPWRLLVVTGFLGGFTTFSSLTFETVLLWRRGEMLGGLANLVGSLVLGCSAVIVGMVLARYFVVESR